MCHRLWLPAVAIHRVGVVEIAPSPHHCFRTTHPCAQWVKGWPTEPVLSRSSRQRLGHLQSHCDGGWHVCQAVFPEPQSAAACRRLERRDCAHEALPRLQSASSWLMMEQLVSGVCRLSCAFHALGNSPPDVRRSDTGQYVYAVQVRWFEAARDDSAAVVWGRVQLVRVCRPCPHRAGVFGS